MKCSRDVYIKPDSGLSDVASKSFDAVVLPGGAPGAKALAEVRTDNHSMVRSTSCSFIVIKKSLYSLYVHRMQWSSVMDYLF